MILPRLYYKTFRKSLTQVHVRIVSIRQDLKPNIGLYVKSIMKIPTENITKELCYQFFYHLINREIKKLFVIFLYCKVYLQWNIILHFVTLIKIVKIQKNVKPKKTNYFTLNRRHTILSLSFYFLCCCCSFELTK